MAFAASDNPALCLLGREIRVADRVRDVLADMLPGVVHAANPQAPPKAA